MYLEYVLCDCKISFEVECLLEREKIDFIPFFPSSHKKFSISSQVSFFIPPPFFTEATTISLIWHQHQEWYITIKIKIALHHLSFHSTWIFFLLLPFKTCKLFFLCRTTLCALERKVKLINLWMMFLAHLFGFKNSWFCG